MKVRFISIVLLFIVCLSIVRTSGATEIITVSVNPAKVPGRIGKNIEFDIYLSEIDESVVYDLWAWNLKLTWVDIEFNLVSVEEGEFLKQSLSGETQFVQQLSSSGGFETLSLASTVKWDPQYGDPHGVLGEGILVTISLYVIAGTTGSRFELSDIQLRNSGPVGKNQIWPPYTPPGHETPLYDVIVLDEAGEFIRAQKPEDIEPTYGVIDAYDLGVVAANYNLNVVRSKKISTDWDPDPTASWDNAQNLGASDELRASTNTEGASTTWKYFMFNTTGWTGVQKVEVGLETYIDSGTCNISIALSNDNGTSFSETTFNHTVASVKYDEFTWIDVTSAYSWTLADIGSIAVNMTFRRVAGANIQIDYLVVAVTPLDLLSPPDAFDPDADVDNSRVVDIDDLVSVAVNYGSYSLEVEE